MEGRGRLQKVCENAKLAGIAFYTVAFGVTDDATRNLLSEWATEPPYAYAAETASDLIGAFQKIASRLSELRLTN